jgi:hypothetical protein
MKLNRKRYWLIGLGSLVVLIALLYLPLQRVFHDYTSKLVYATLSDMVETSTEGKYVIEYDDLRYSIFKQRIKLSNFAYYPKDTSGLLADTFADVNKYHVGIEVKTMEIIIENQLDFFMTSELRIANVKIDEPYVRVLNQRVKKQEVELGKFAGNLYQIVTDYLKIFELSNLEVNKARMTYYLNTKGYFKTFDFNPFSFKVRDFKMDKSTGFNSKDNPLFSEDFEFNSGQQSFVLPDSVHKVSFDRFTVSLRKEYLELNNVKIEPIIAIDSIKTSHIDVFVPTLKLKGVDFEKAYLENEIDIEKLVIERPAIVLNWKEEKQLDLEKVDTSIALNIDSNLLGAIGKILVNRTVLTRANVRVDVISKTTKRTLNVKGFTYKGSDIELDSAKLANFKTSDLQRNFKFQAFEVQHKMPEEGLELKAFNLNYSSITKVLDIEGAYFLTNQMQLSKNVKQHAKQVYLNQLEIERMHLSNFPLTDCIDERKLDLKAARLTRPILTLFYDTAYSPDSVNIDSNKHLFNHPLVDSLLHKRIDIQGAKIVLTDPYGLKKQYGEINKLDIFYQHKSNKGNLDVFHFLSHSALKTGRGYVKIPGVAHKANWSATDFSSARHRFKARGLNYQGQLQNSKASARINKLLITQFYPEKILQTKQYNLGLIELEKGNLELITQGKRKVKANKPPDFSVDSIAISELDIMVAKKDSIRQKFDNVRMNLGQLSQQTDSLNKTKLSLNHFLLACNSGFVSIDNNRHYIELGGLRVSSNDSTLQVNNLELKPVLNSKLHTKNAVMRSSIHSIDISGLHLNKDDIEQRFSADHIDICSPSFRISKPNANKLEQQPKESREIIELHKWFSNAIGLNQINYKSLNIENGVLDADWFDANNKKWHLSFPQYDVKVSDFNINSSATNQRNRFMYARDYSIVVYNPEQIFPDTNRYFTAQKLEYSTQTEYLKLTKPTGKFMIYRRDSSKQLLVNGSMDEFEAKGIDPLEIEKNKNLKLNRLHFQHPNIKITQFHKKTPYVSRELETSQKGDDEAAIKKLLFKNVGIRDGHITWEFDDTSKQGFEFVHVNIDGNQIEHNSKGSEKPRFGEIQMSFGNFKHQVMEKYYDAGLDSFYLNSKSKELMIWGASLSPRYGIFEFSKLAGWQKVRLELKLNKLEMQQFDAKGLIYNNTLSSELILADSLWTRSFKNKNYSMINRNMPLPQTMLRNLPITVNVDSLRLNHGRVVHRQLAMNGVKSGRLSFSEMQASMNNITNDSAKLAKNKTMQLIASTKLMDQGQIDAQFEFDLEDTVDHFTGKAQLGEFDATLLNEFVEPTQYIRIRKGMVQGGEVEFEATDSLGFGQMRLLYKNLHVDFLNHKHPDKGKSMGLLMKTFLANRVVNTQNPHLFITKKGDVYYRRDTSKAIFHYWGRLAMSGVASSTGVASNKKELRKIKRHVDQVRKDALRREKAIRRREEEEEEELAKKKKGK